MSVNAPGVLRACSCRPTWAAVSLWMRRRCSMMSGNPVGFGQARISISSVVPVPVAILNTSWTPAPIKSAVGMFVCVHGNSSCFCATSMRRSCLNPCSNPGGGASRLSASTIFQIRSMWSSCSASGNRLIFQARQQLMAAFFRASCSSTKRTCGSMKDEKQDATVNCLNFMSRIRWAGQRQASGRAAPLCAPVPVCC